MTWADRRDTITNLFALAPPFVPSDRLFVGPGVYRESATLPGVDGATVTAAGTAGVTNESTAVVGVGTAFGGAQATDQLFIGNFRTAADGACAGGVLVMTSATGNFDTDLVGYMLEIVGIGAYLIASVPNGTTLNLLDLNGILNPAGGAGYTYYIVAGEGPYEIASVTDALNLTLVKPWSGPTITGCPFEIYRPIYLIADVTGENTDGVGGIIRLTGTNDDTADPGIRTRVDGVVGASREYWHVRGFTVTSFSQHAYWFDQCDMICVEDTVGIDNVAGLFLGDDPTRHILRRAISLGGYSGPIFMLAHTASIANSQSLGENLYAESAQGMYIDDVAGTTIKNLTMGFYNDYCLSVPAGMPLGSAVFIHDSLIHYCTAFGVSAGANGRVIENMNNFWQNTVDRGNVTNTGGVDTAYAYLPMLPLLTGRPRNPMEFFPPSEWEQTRYATGLYGANEDLFGVHSEIAQTRRSWGAMHAYAVKRETAPVYGTFVGTLYLENASEAQFTYPVQPSVTYTITVQVYVETNYAGSVPDMVIRQPGAVDVTATSSGAAGVWEQLTTTFTSGADMNWISVALRSHNTSTTPSYGVRWNDIQVR